MASHALVADDAKYLSDSESTRRWSGRLLALCMFATGGCGFIAECILSTVASFILGNSIHQWSITMGLMLSMMGLAACVQLKFTNRYLVEKFIAVEVALALLVGYAALGIYAGHAYLNDHFVLVHYSFVCGIGFLIGLEIPLVMRIMKKLKKDLRTNIAMVQGWDYVGAFVFTFLWVYVLLRTFPLTEIGFLLAGINLLVAMVAIVFFLYHRMVKRPVWISSMILVAVASLLVGFTYNRDLSKHMIQKLYDDPIVFVKKSPYQFLVMTHYRPLQEYRFFINGSLQFSSYDEYIYHENLVVPIMELVPNHDRILILGGGDGLALRDVLRYSDVREVALVDLDPAMPKFCANNEVMRKLNQDSFADARVAVLEHNAITPTEWVPVYQGTGKIDEKRRPVVEEVAQVQVYNLDADKFVSATDRKWDIIIIDLPDPSSVELTKLYSQEFYMKLRRILSEHGMIVIQSTSPYHAKESFLCIGRTLAAAKLSAVPYHDNVPSFGDWGFWIAGKNNVMSSEGLKKKLTGIESFSIPTKHLTPEVLRSNTVFAKKWLQAKNSRVNTILDPVLLNYYVYESWLND